MVVPSPIVRPTVGPAPLEALGIHAPPLKMKAMARERCADVEPSPSMLRSAMSIWQSGVNEISDTGLQYRGASPKLNGNQGGWISCRRVPGTKSPAAVSATDQMRLGIGPEARPGTGYGVLGSWFWPQTL
jgi:hypothetical protein